MEVTIMIDFIVILWVTLAIVGPIAILTSWNASNGEYWINKTINEVPGFCPYKYKWQVADDLSMRDESAKFSYLMTMPKQQVKDLWMMEVHNIPT